MNAPLKKQKKDEACVWSPLKNCAFTNEKTSIEDKKFIFGSWRKKEPPGILMDI